MIVSCCKATGLAASAAWLPFIAPVSSTHLNVGHKWLEPFWRNMHLYLNSITLGTSTGGQSGLVVFVIMLEVKACGLTHSLKTIRSGRFYRVGYSPQTVASSTSRAVFRTANSRLLVS